MFLYSLQAESLRLDAVMREVGAMPLLDGSMLVFVGDLVQKILKQGFDRTTTIGSAKSFMWLAPVCRDPFASVCSSIATRYNDCGSRRSRFLVLGLLGSNWR